ncbi:tyrosine-type recombinase/integrase [Flexilinea flocculi]|nr:phage integrase N-terminal SAM-like domain-containing protein [Flexilinea flocculi]
MKKQNMEKGESSVREFVNADTTFPAAIHAWEIHLADEDRTGNTIKAFINDIQLLASFFPPDRSIGSIKTRDINAFLNWMENERKVPCSPKTYSRRITSIKSFFKWLKTYGILSEDPAETVIQKSVISPLPEILTSVEVPLVLETADHFRYLKKPDARPMALLYLLISTGIKKSETLGISPNHFDFDIPDNPVLYIRYDTPGNRYKERKIDLPINWINIYNEYVNQAHPTKRLFDFSARRLEYILEDIGTAAGLKKHLSFNMCRWTCMVHDYYTNTDPEAIRMKMGVSKIQWREIFMKLEKLRDQYA